MAISVSLDDTPEGGWKAAKGIPMPDFVEPVLTVTVLLLAMLLTRRKGYNAFQSKSRYQPIPEESPRSSDELDDDTLLSRRQYDQYPPKHRSFGPCLRFTTPNSSRFAQNIHSRILQKFPFLMEMFYWGLSFGAYRYTKVLAQTIYGGQRSMWDSAQQHGLSILNFEALLLGNAHRQAPERWLEWRIQRWFLHGTELGDCRGWILSLLNRGYALVHLPGTVSFLAYYYATASSHARFSTVRRTMTLSNFLAFAIFILVPTMPPRLMPKELGFVDSVSLEDAESVWMGGDFVNLLAAMPSMHFAYAFCIGCTFIAESGVVRGLFSWLEAITIRSRKTEGDEEEDGEESVEKNHYRRRSALARAAMFAFGVWYPTWMLITIVSTANHYFLDAFAAILVVLAGYMLNRVLCVFLPVEDYLLWLLRLEKPIPTTGWKKKLTVA
ncbi:uncharacterized protein CPUR_05502 [Claviceps purpurea 20.1]|uniref:Inositolphosphotransferase Aur1/Ipt1 domain-containing protein n=1 Tax=Claviceps purpurea (strain 20.1) TaxID=1111077 RepID=M1WGB9_CLAP2|nr:hypothetical protein E4U50_006652 [Claviceps purpurea]CCE31649.1 uncharacterized protein CPUR_05502 [Claviceps purpurea 20.1]